MGVLADVLRHAHIFSQKFWFGGLLPPSKSAQSSNHLKSTPWREYGAISLNYLYVALLLKPAFLLPLSL